MMHLFVSKFSASCDDISRWQKNVVIAGVISRWGGKKIVLQPFRPYFCTFSEGLRVPITGAVPPVVVGGSLAVKPIVQEVLKICRNFLRRGHRSG